MSVKEPNAVNPDVEFVDKNGTPPVVEHAPKAEVKIEKPEVKVEKPAPAAPAPAIAISKGELESALIAFVVEQTGYPEDMVDMDADLEGDLGIDSIKKAQLMGELNEKYHFVDVSAPADNNMSLDDFTTLGSIRDYLLSKAGGAGDAPVEKQEVKSEPQEESASAPLATDFQKELEAFLINFVVEQTGYPADMIEMDVSLDADLGIDSIKKAQLFSEISEKYELVPLGDMSLDDFKTLSDIYNAILQYNNQ